MSFLMRKRVFLNLHKCRIFMKNFRNENSYLLNRCCRRNVVVSQQLCLATVAHQHKLNEDLPAIKSGNINDASIIKEIDKDLSNIDWTIRRSGRINRRTVESVFLKMKNAELSSHSATHGLYLLRCCGRILEEAPSKRIELANEIWNTLIKLGCSFDIRHYNSLLRIYLDNNHHFSPTDFLSKLDADQIQPDKVTYLYLMEKYCNDGNLTGASEILEFMKEKKLPVNEAVFNSLIKGHVKTQDFSGAMNILDVMRASNLSPTADSYTAIACGYASKGDIDEMKSVLIRAKNNGVTISQRHYFQLINAAATGDHVHE
ncbi:leucine-rich PPR motif-containing protein, mitochondrial-like, partial [Stegodyphus dumicola]|uniref:leucine-rich PPR motif-containing protein, mitochondrial-like n=1 Tax=Stegodyphus dumicola TaxID=202533 RepID=UPI0015AD828C